MKDGWVITKGLGVYGTDYMKRAVVAAFGWPANRQEDAVYPYTEVDAEGQTAHRREQLHAHVREGADPAGERLLVDHHVRDRPGLVVRAEPARTSSRSARATSSRTTRTARSRSTSRTRRRARRRKRTGCPRRRAFIADAAHVLAQGEAPSHPRRELAAAGGGEDELGGRDARRRGGDRGSERDPDGRAHRHQSVLRAREDVRELGLQAALEAQLRRVDRRDEARRQGDRPHPLPRRRAQHAALPARARGRERARAVQARPAARARRGEAVQRRDRAGAGPRATRARARCSSTC